MRVLLADDREKVRSALRLLLEQEKNLEVVGEADSSGCLLSLAEVQCPDVLLMDWDLPGGPAPNCLTALRRMLPEVKIIALSVRPEVRWAAQEAGVEAFVCKNAPSEELLAAINSLYGR